MSQFMAITMQKQQKELEKKKADDNKQNHYHCAVYKSLPSYDDEKAGANTQKLIQYKKYNKQKTK